MVNVHSVLKRSASKELWQDISAYLHSNKKKLEINFGKMSSYKINVCKFTWLSYPHLTDKWHLLIFKYDKVIDILVWSLSDFHTLKDVCAEKQQDSVCETTQWTLCLVFHSHFVCSNCSPSAFLHVFSHGVELLTALLISTCSRLSQTTWNASFSILLHAKKRLHKRYLKRRAGCQFNCVDIIVT